MIKIKSSMARSSPEENRIWSIINYQQYCYRSSPMGNSQFRSTISSYEQWRQRWQIQLTGRFLASNTELETWHAASAAQNHQGVPPHRSGDSARTSAAHTQQEVPDHLSKRYFSSVLFLSYITWDSLQQPTRHTFSSPPGMPLVVHQACLQQSTRDAFSSISGMPLSPPMCDDCANGEVLMPHVYLRANHDNDNRPAGKMMSI